MPPFHLCQPGAGASCGACCGLYNFRDHSQPALARSLQRHTNLIRSVPRTPEAFRSAAAALRAEEAAPAFPDVRTCPLLGFLDEGRTKVGCLAHPLQTGGIDLRDCGVYDAQICQSFECPSFIWLTDAQARLVRAACPDWYLYGLVITDVELVRGVLRLVERVRGESVDADRIVARPAALQAARALFELKAQGDGRDADGIFGQFAPDPKGEPGLRQIDYRGLGTHAAPEDDVLLCLGYAPETIGELEQARQEIRSRVDALASALDPS